MNYLAHGHLYLDDPYFLAGTATPDWLCVSDRGVKVRARRAERFVGHADRRVAALARGIVRHHEDDARFHASRPFVELSLQATVCCRVALAKDEGFRPSFLGHILVELLLDAMLAAEEQDRLDRYYRALESVDASSVASAVEQMAERRIERLARFIELFRSERFLLDYADDEKLLFRLNQVMRRVGLRPLPTSFLAALAKIRQAVGRRWRELLIEISQPV